MSKGMAMLAATMLALALAPAAGSAQQVGASFRIAPRPVQPGLVAEQDAVDARVPAGWAYGVSRGSGGGAGSPALASGVARSERVAVELPAETVAGDGRRTVTLTFVPL